MKRNKNAIKTRIPKSVETIQQLEATFINKVEKVSLASLSLDELAHRFDDIEQQSQLLQGQILLEARNRFPSKIEFGAWVQEIGGSIAACGKQHRTTLMNLAKYFNGKDLTGISITAAYQISAPINADVADEVYEYAKLKNLPVSEIKKQIQKRKTEKQSKDDSVIESSPVKVTPIQSHQNYIFGSVIPNAEPYITGKPLDGLPDVEDEIELETDNADKPQEKPDIKSQIMAIAKTTSPQLAIAALQDCIRELNALRYPQR